MVPTSLLRCFTENCSRIYGSTQVSNLCSSCSYPPTNQVLPSMRHTNNFLAWATITCTLVLLVRFFGRQSGVRPQSQARLRVRNRADLPTAGSKIVLQSSSLDTTGVLTGASKNIGGDVTAKDVILTSFFNFQKDPQRKRYVPLTFGYMANFYNSVNYYGLYAVIFHNGLPQQFVKRYQTNFTRFIEVHIDKKQKLSTNDFRFLTYMEHLKKKTYRFVLMADLSDVFFNSNPFAYFANHQHGHTLFMSPDIGNFHKNAWRVKPCYENEGSTWDQGVKMHNAGVWGGDYDITRCILRCMSKQFQKIRGYNCNMPVLNWCVHFGDCADEKAVEDQPDFVNPFRKECKGEARVIHNKCKNSNNLCLIERGHSLVLVPKRHSCKLVFDLPNEDSNDDARQNNKNYNKYVQTQISKLEDPLHHINIARDDREKIESALYQRFSRYQMDGIVHFKQKSAVCIGARLGGEVRALRRLGALAVGVDLNPGDNNPHVLQGDAHSIGFASGSVEILYSNVLDHILDINAFVEQVADVLANGGLFLMDLSKKAPDIYATHDFRTKKKDVLRVIEQYFVVLTELDELKPEKVWFILCKRKARKDGKNKAIDTILVVGKNIDEVSKQTLEFKRQGAFVIAMSPNVSKDKIVLDCSSDISKDAFTRVFIVGNESRPCRI